MRKKIRKLTALLCAGTMALSMAACGSSGEEKKGDTGEKTEEKTEKTGETAALEDALNPDEPVELTLWSIATETDSYHNAFVKALEDFEKTYPNVKINMEIFENESYKTKLKSAVAANELPDIFYSWQGGFSQSFAEAGKMLDLDPYYETYKEELPESATSNARYVDGSLYGTSYSVNCSLLMYNKAMFEKYGLEAPETWDEFVSICQKFVDEGITPLTVSAKETWVLAVFHDALALKSAGNEKTVKTLTRQGGSYDDKDFLFAAEELEKLVKMGAFVDGAAGLTRLEAETLFTNGEVPMLVQLANVCMDNYGIVENPEDFDVVPFPVVGGNAEITDMIGGCSESLMVSANTENPDAAGYAAFELSKRIADVAYADGVTSSPWTSTPKNDDISEFGKKIEEYKAQATSYCLWWDTEMVADDASEYLSLLEQLFVGNISAEDFVKGMDAQLSNE
ncbi:Multiple sugar-binding protein [Blautia producta]|uniref:Multiple sugar-binding protein n=1 Tax=Blautia producta TaxID=33035 RepID=A0A4P6M367_9FIRM|nr:extracellular solute-binding protein [Blautia producta]QBE99564.1 Multiple sugar-binding protein [Blautia producta]